MKLHKLISVVCAALIALTTIIYTALPAFASDTATDDVNVASSFEELAEMLYDTIYDGEDYLGIKPAFTAFCEELLEAGWYYSEDLLALVDPTSDYMYSRGGGGGRIRSGRSGSRGRSRIESADDVIIGSETFTQIVQRLQEQYGYNIGSDDYKILSWKKEVNPYYITDFSLYAQGVGLPIDGTECYVVGFYYDGTNYYFSRHQYHFYIDISDSTTKLKYASMDMLDTAVTEYSLFSWDTDLTVYPYITISSTLPSNARYPEYFSVHATAEYDHFINPYAYNWASPAIAPGWLLNNNFYLDTFTSVTWASIASQFTAKPVGGEAFDVGFIVSPEHMNEYLADIDATKISSDGTVSMGGTTIYEYTITNSDGDSTTINEYVTNNYTYITNNNGDDSSSSDGGSTSGNVIVGGNVAVDGAIDVGGQVDININVNENEEDFVAPDTNLVENLPEEPTEFTDYLAILFAKLPVDVLGLILGGIAAAIFCRVWGR